MSDRRPDFDDEDLELGEPVTDTLEVLLEALPDDSWSEGGEVDLGEPVTDRLRMLLAELPAGSIWSEQGESDEWNEPVTDRLDLLLGALPKGQVEDEDESLGRPVATELSVLLGEPAAGSQATDIGEEAIAGPWRSLWRELRGLFGGGPRGSGG